MRVFRQYSHNDPRVAAKHKAQWPSLLQPHNGKVLIKHNNIQNVHRSISVIVIMSYTYDYAAP